MSKFKVIFKADTEGNWCSQCTGRVFDSREEAQAAIDADETTQPDPYGNTCDVEIIEIEDDSEADDTADDRNLTTKTNEEIHRIIVGDWKSVLDQLGK